MDLTLRKINERLERVGICHEVTGIPTSPDASSEMALLVHNIEIKCKLAAGIIHLDAS